MATCVGIDLAWSGRYPSGLCAVEAGEHGERLIRLDAAVQTVDGLADWLVGLPAPVVVAIDAPLIVGGDRWAERALAGVFGRYGAGAYTPHPRFLALSGTAGQDLAVVLARRGFSLDPSAIGTAGRVAMEVYPHAAHIVLFGLGQVLRYKRGPVGRRREVLATYQGHLRRALEASMPGLHDSRLDALLDPAILATRGRQLKGVEDQLDAVTCMLVAYRAWRDGPAAMAVFGCRSHGYIVTPGLPAGGAQPALTCPACQDNG